METVPPNVAINAISAQQTIMSLLVRALAAQAPDQAKLLSDFAASVEQLLADATAESPSEVHYQELHRTAATWTALLSERSGSG